MKKVRKSQGRGVTIEDLKHLVSLFAVIEDRRVKARCSHLLVDVVVIAICAMICGAEGVFDIEDFGDSHEEWLKTFLKLPNGIPSHDTFSRVISLVCPSQIEALFFEWVQTIRGQRTENISVDGKSIRGTQRDKTQGLRPLLSVSVYSHEQGLTLMQTTSKGSGSSESEAASECLKALDLKGVCVLADAALATRAVTDQIKQKDGFYIIPIKKNNRATLKQIQDAFDRVKATSAHQTTDKNHGRKEKRCCEVICKNEIIEKGMFSEAKSIVKIHRKREFKDTRSLIQTTKNGAQSYITNKNKIRIEEEVTYYASNKNLTAKEALERIRTHWGIENKVHWILDTAFREDNWRTRDKTLAHNLSVLRRMAFNLVKCMPEQKSVRRKMKMAGWNTNYLEQIIFK